MCVCVYAFLCQVYETLFTPHVSRINFKMRMRKLKICSNRASSLIRTKLVSIGAIPQGCPVCCLISISELEQLARSYGIERPPVLYEVFLNLEKNQDQNQNQNLHHGRTQLQQYRHSNQQQQQNHTRMDYQSEDPLHQHSVQTSRTVSFLTLLPPTSQITRAVHRAWPLLLISSPLR